MIAIIMLLGALAPALSPIGTVLAQNDSDGDGVDDVDDECPNTPTGIPVDAVGCAESQLDDDGDGVTNDLDECPDDAGNDADGDGVSDEANGCPDMDGDGIWDMDDQCPNDNADGNGDGVEDTPEGCPDEDDDGTYDMDDQCPGTAAGDPVDWNGCPDSDNDGVNDAEDQCPNTNPGDWVDGNGCPDTDGDGWNDGDDAFPNDPNEWEDFDGDGTGDNADDDDDNDGVLDIDDQCPHTDAQHAANVNTGGCSDYDIDTDGDGLSDGEENDLGTDPQNPDSDGDGLDDREEAHDWGTNPLIADSDGDGLNDGDEVNTHGTDPTLSDTDGDTLSDGEEIGIGTDPNAYDTDNDGLHDGEEGDYNTDPTLSDTDGDGLSDGFEVHLLWGVTDATNADTDGDGVEDGHEDGDGDNMSNQDEQAAGTDPQDEDSDGDGVWDDTDVCPTDPTDWCAGDDDGDGVSNGEDPCPDDVTDWCAGDDDQDGVPNGEDNCPDEYGSSSDGCPTWDEMDDDGDGIPNGYDECPHDPGYDLDQDGVTDGNGCPDMDGDGIWDMEDQCPDEAGPQETWGCPDTDGDGVWDMDDWCPDDQGPHEWWGCPDSDGDGWHDGDDNCPDEYGDDWGCPYEEDMDECEWFEWNIDLNGDGANVWNHCVTNWEFSQEIRKIFDEGFYTCDDGEIIPFSLVNNGEVDCWDWGSDEPFDEDDNGVDDYEFPCDDGTTILFSLVNDGQADCGDGSDESGADGHVDQTDIDAIYDTLIVLLLSEEDEVEFVCGDGDKILFDEVNNGEDDCGDGSDEQLLGEDSDEINWFDCFDGTTISMTLVNDGNWDCPVGEDEGEGYDDDDIPPLYWNGDLVEANPMWAELINLEGPVDGNGVENVHLNRGWTHDLVIDAQAEEHVLKLEGGDDDSGDDWGCYNWFNDHWEWGYSEPECNTFTWNMHEEDHNGDGDFDDEGEMWEECYNNEQGQWHGYNHEECTSFGWDIYEDNGDCFNIKARGTNDGAWVIHDIEVGGFWEGWRYDGDQHAPWNIGPTEASEMGDGDCLDPSPIIIYYQPPDPFDNECDRIGEYHIELLELSGEILIYGKCVFNMDDSIAMREAIDNEFGDGDGEVTQGEFDAFMLEVVNNEDDDDEYWECFNGENYNWYHEFSEEECNAFSWTYRTAQTKQGSWMECYNSWTDSWYPDFTDVECDSFSWEMHQDDEGGCDGPCLLWDGQPFGEEQTHYVEVNNALGLWDNGMEMFLWDGWTASIPDGIDYSMAEHQLTLLSDDDDDVFWECYNLHTMNWYGEFSEDECNAFSWQIHEEDTDGDGQIDESWNECYNNVTNQWHWFSEPECNSFVWEMHEEEYGDEDESCFTAYFHGSENWLISSVDHIGAGWGVYGAEDGVMMLMVEQGNIPADGECSEPTPITVTYSNADGGGGGDDGDGDCEDAEWHADMSETGDFISLWMVCTYSAEESMEFRNSIDVAVGNSDGVVSQQEHDLFLTMGGGDGDDEGDGPDVNLDGVDLNNGVQWSEMQGLVGPVDSNDSVIGYFGTTYTTDIDTSTNTHILIIGDDDEDGEEVDNSCFTAYFHDGQSYVVTSIDMSGEDYIATSHAGYWKISPADATAETCEDPDPVTITFTAISCTLAWTHSSDTGWNQGTEIIAASNGAYEVELVPGNYFVGLMCANTLGYTIEVAWSLDGGQTTTLVSNEDEMWGWTSFEISANLAGSMTFEYEWTISGGTAFDNAEGTDDLMDGSGSVTITFTCTGDDCVSTDDIVDDLDNAGGGILPGFSGLLAFTAMAGAVLFARRYD